MVEENKQQNNQQQKRQVAYKVSVNSILNGQYIKEEGWNPNHIKLDDGRDISRVNLIGVVVDKPVEENTTQQNVMIDDGSANISLKLFEDNNLFTDINVGDSVLIIGRPREFGDERYIVPEIIKKIEDPNWIKLRKLELGNKNAPLEKDKIEVYNSAEEDILEEEGDIISLIKKLDQGDGADFNDIVEKCGKENGEKIINNMIKIGELFEIKPGKIKVLE
jgi:RPA family protein